MGKVTYNADVEHCNNTLNKMYQEFCKWRKEHPDSLYIIFDTSSTYWGYPLNRYVVMKGIELYCFFGDVIVSTISGIHQLHQPITCASQKEATELCEKLNAKYVYYNEPQIFANCPTWQEAYKKYYL